MTDNVGVDSATARRMTASVGVRETVMTETGILITAISLFLVVTCVVVAVVAWRRTRPPPVTAVSAPEPARQQPAMTSVPDIPAPSESSLPDVCYSIRLYGQAPVPIEVLYPLIQRLKERRLPVCRVLGCADDSGQWQLTPKKTLPYWLIALPLANRDGCLTADRIATITRECEQFAHHNSFHLILTPVQQAIDNARLLDEFCQTVDVILELRLDVPTHLAQATQLMRMHGMTPENGRYEFRYESELLFSAQTRERPAVVIFKLDAPNVSDCARALDRMMGCIGKVAGALGVTITDSSGKAVDEERIADIRKRLVLIKKSMIDYGVVPGSAMATLLFS